MFVRSVVVYALAGASLLGCAPAAPAVPPPGAPVRQQHRPDGLIYNVAGGIGVGGTRAVPHATLNPGLAALAGLTVGLSGWDWIIVGLRVDVGVVGPDSLGDLGVHLSLFPGANGVGPLRDFQLFADATIGSPLVSQGNTGGAIGMGRIGIAWERWRLSSVSIGPFLAGQTARGAAETQSAAFVGVSASFTNVRTPR
jgi:hypothetical protein